MFTSHYEYPPGWVRTYREYELERRQQQQVNPEDTVFAQQVIPLCEQAIRKSWTGSELADVETAIRIFRLRVLQERNYPEVAQAVGLQVADVVRLSRRIAQICKETVQQAME